MLTRGFLYFAFALALLTLNPLAPALTVEQTVNTGYIKDHPGEFSIQAEKRDDGLIHFTIKQTLKRPSYLVVATEISAGGKVIFKSSACSYAREDSATFYVSVAPDQIANTKFTIFQGSFVESAHEPVAEPGGIDFQIALSDFANASDGKIHE
jgi:hypothetical protein